MSDPLTPSPGEPGYNPYGNQAPSQIMPSGSYGVTPTMWLNASTANAAINLANRDTTDREIKLKELALSEKSGDQAQERFMEEL